MMKRLLTALAVALVLLAVNAPASLAQRDRGQEATVRSVEGVVTDDQGNPVVGAVVHLKNTKTLQIRSFITKEDGRYSFHGLSTNVDYELKAEHQGASSDVKTLSVFDSRSKAVINLKISRK
jgi:hypothetical protein